MPPSTKEDQLSLSEGNMTEPKTDTGAATDKKAKREVPISIDEFAAAIAGMSRLLGKVSSAQPFKDAGIGLAEWSALNSLIAEQSEAVSNKQLAKSLGVSGQRANQICDSLKSTGLAGVSPSPDDGRKVMIKITAAGRARLKTVNETLLPMLVAKAGNRGAALQRMNRTLKVLGRTFSSADTEKSDKKENRKLKKAKKSD
jgi:DNA-binding MarR family transcriptional regulator